MLLGVVRGILGVKKFVRTSYRYRFLANPHYYKSSSSF